MPVRGRFPKAASTLALNPRQSEMCGEAACDDATEYFSTRSLSTVLLAAPLKCHYINYMKIFDCVVATLVSFIIVR